MSTTIDKIKKLRLLTVALGVVLILIISCVSFIFSEISPDKLKQYLENKYDSDFFVDGIESATGWIAGRSVVPVADGGLKFNVGIKWAKTGFLIYRLDYTDNYYEVLRTRLYNKAVSNRDFRLNKKTVLQQNYRKNILPYTCESRQLLNVTDQIIDMITQIETGLDKRGVTIPEDFFPVSFSVYMAGEYRNISFYNSDRAYVRDRLKTEFVKYHTIAWIRDQYELCMNSEEDVNRTVNEIYEIMQIVQKELKAHLIQTTENRCEIGVDVLIDGTSKRVSFEFVDKKEIRKQLASALTDDTLPITYG